MMEDKLPKGWTQAKLKEVLSVKNGYAFKSQDFKDYGIPVIRISNIQDGQVLIQNSAMVPKELFNKNFVVERGDILVAMSGATTGKYGIYNGSEIALQNQRVGNLKPNTDKVSKKFIYYLLGNLKKEIEYVAYGAAQPNISAKMIEDLEFFLPPLPEQQRIVAKLDALFGHLDRLREKLDGIPALLKNFRQQVLTQAVKGELTKEWREGKGLGEWEYIGLQDVADVIDPHPSHRTPPPVLGGVPYISIKDVDSNGRIDFKNSTLVSPKVLEEHIKRYELKDGDLGFGKIGTLGKPFRLPIFKERTYTLSANIILIQPKSNYNPKFLFYYLDSPIINKLLKEGAKATSQPAFGIKKARVFPTPYPFQEEQQEIVNRVDSLFSLADKIESQYTSLKAKIDQLPQAILAKAFRGELVGQEAKEYMREIGELGMVAEGEHNF